MATALFRRAAGRRLSPAVPSLTRLCSFLRSSLASPPAPPNGNHSILAPTNHLDRKQLAPPHPTENLTIHPPLSHDLWGLSSPRAPTFLPPEEEDPEPLDEIDDMRLRKSLVYKAERKDSRAYEERSVVFHKTKRNKVIWTSEALNPKLAKPRRRRRRRSPAGGITRDHPPVSCPPPEAPRARSPDRSTEPYHFPFCLDIYVSKGSVRACIVHRVSSKVVVVAHSISRDMRLDLGSRKDAAASVAVGAALAQRAISDDIHNVVYTPRKGERIEGKLQLVLQAVIHGGIDVRMKIKQRRQQKKLNGGHYMEWTHLILNGWR